MLYGMYGGTGRKDMVTYSGSMLDEVLSRVGIIRSRNLLLDEEVVEAGDGLELLLLGGLWFGAFGATEAVVFRFLGRLG